MSNKIDIEEDNEQEDVFEVDILDEIHFEMYKQKRIINGLQCLSTLLAVAADKGELPNSHLMDGIIFTFYAAMIASHEKLDGLHTA